MGCNLWLQWTLMTFLGFLTSLFWIEIGERPDVGAVEGIIGGSLIGLAQLLVLRQHISRAGWWVLVSLLSWGLIGFSGLGALGWFAPRTLYLFPRVLYGVLDGAKIGFLLGVGQWIVLRQQVSSAWLWILASPLCWSIALALGWTIGGALRLFTHLFLSEVVGLAVTWLAVGVLTGITLMGLLWETAMVNQQR
ncbi:hypothetical protein IQ257_06345 [Coleofasciculus sp. LEGE 07092]|nr:hypothetical protein [Coleofasciculus sp. LEGE 07081]MBE9148138.1 hypothetical protein [Coleofasciculus sp. LEGE 07092]